MRIVRRRRKRARVIVAGARRKVGGRQPLEPGVAVGREHGERPARLRQNFVAFEDHLVLCRAEGDPAPGEVLGDGGVAIPRRRLVVAVRVHRLDAKRRGQLRDRGSRVRVTDDQPAAARAQRGGEFGDAVVDELDAAVLACGQRVEDLAVEDERAVDRAARRRARGGARRGRSRADRGETRPARWGWGRRLGCFACPRRSPRAFDVASIREA